MSSLLKLSLTAIVVILTAWCGHLWWSTYVVGGLYANGGIIASAFGALVPVLLATAAYYGFRVIWR